MCGEPFPEFVAFFADYKQEMARVLDLGCGQGRDALMIARKGHQVVGVDLSPTGIAQMVGDGEAEGLNIEGFAADIVTYVPEGLFDVIVMDRVLHMLLDDKARTAVLQKANRHLKNDGYMLIADTPKQKELLQTYFADWEIVRKRKGILIVQKHITDQRPKSVVQ